MSETRLHPHQATSTEYLPRAYVGAPGVCEKAVAPAMTSQTRGNLSAVESDIKHCPVCKTVYNSPILFYCSYETARLVNGPVASAVARASAPVPRRTKTGGNRLRIQAMVALACLSFVAICLLQSRPVNAPLAVPPGVVLGPQPGRYLLDVDAPLPFLRRGNPATQFQALRQLVIAGAGFDFLAKCGDMMRARNLKSSKPGVVYLSRHKSGDAFDYNQEDSRVLIVREQKEGLTYWRTYLVCDTQDGTKGIRAELDTDNAGKVSAYVFDFTAAAEGLGWERIPAREGWRRDPSKKEYWHYEMPEGLSFERALTLVNSQPPVTDRLTPEVPLKQSQTPPNP